MARYVDVLELEKRIKENVQTSGCGNTLYEVDLLEWCKDECIRQAFAIPFVNEALIKADTVRKMQERLKDALNDMARYDFHGNNNEYFIIGKSFIDQIAKEMLEGENDKTE